MFPSQKDDRLTVRGVRHLITALADTADLDPHYPDGDTPDTISPQSIRVTQPPPHDESTPILERALTTDHAHDEPSPIPGRHPVEHPLRDKLPDLFYVVDTNGRFRRWNERLTTVTGYGDEDLADVHAIELITPPDRTMIGDAMVSVFAANTETRETPHLHRRR